MANEVEVHAGRAAFLSTPSIFFSLKNKELRANCVLFDLDPQWTHLDNYVIYDFNKPDELPEELAADFDYAVIDPPFITHEVWALYAVATRKLLKPGGKYVVPDTRARARSRSRARAHTRGYMRTHVRAHTHALTHVAGALRARRILISTIPENADFLRKELGVEPRPFQPSIPNLVYQYCLYSNYESAPLMELNPEIPQDD